MKHFEGWELSLPVFTVLNVYIRLPWKHNHVLVVSCLLKLWFNCYFSKMFLH